MSKTKKLTPRMQRVLDRLKAGETLYYSTTILTSGGWFHSPYERVHDGTLTALRQRGLVEMKYQFPTGTMVLTEAGRAA